MTPWTVACQAPLSMEFRQEYWSGLPFPSSILTNSKVQIFYNIMVKRKRKAMDGMLPDSLSKYVSLSDPGVKKLYFQIIGAKLMTSK